MPILLQPAFSVLPSYRPIKFETFFPFADVSGIIENAVVTIYKGGVPIGPAIRFKSSGNAPNAIPGLTDYFFDIDIQKYCQDLLSPFASFPSIFVDKVTGPIINNDNYDVFRIEVTYEVINLTSGLLVPIGLPEVSNDFFCYTASRQHQEQMDLTDYIGTSFAGDTVFLTKSPRIIDVCEDDNQYLSVIQGNLLAVINAFRVDFFDSAGVLIDFGIAATGAPGLSAQFTINVGLDALANVSWLDGSPTLPNPLIDSYTVTFGYVFVAPGPTYFYITQTETFTYNVVGKCCGLRDLRLHWMNLLGAADSYTFNSEKDLVISTSNDIGQKSLGWITGSTTPNDINDVGNMKLKSEGTTSYLVNSKILTNSEAMWLSELLTSPKVYAELNGEFVPVIVEKTTQSITRHQGKIRIPIKVTLDDLIIQRV